MEYTLIQEVHKDIIYYGIYHTEVESQDGSDILCSIRKRFFEKNQKLKNKSTLKINSELYRYTYAIENHKPLKWKKLLDTQQIEHAVPTQTGYYIETCDLNRKPVKKTYYNNLHLWQKTEYFALSDRYEPIYILTPDFDNDKPIIIRKNKTGKKEILSPFTSVLDQTLTDKLNTMTGEPPIFCRTNYGNFYYCTKEEEIIRKDALEKLLKKEALKENDIPEETIEPAFTIDLSGIDKDNKITISAQPDSQEDLQKENIPETSHELFANALMQKEETSEIISAKTKNCAFLNECPFENSDKLIIESGENKYYYFGSMKDDLRHGRGRTVMQNGCTAYEGDYQNDKRDGFGVYYYKSGTLCYAGFWKENHRHGMGAAFNSSGIELGHFENDQLQGAGVRYEEDKNLFFLKKYQNGEYTGSGTQFDTEGNLLYTGEIKNNIREGKGILYHTDGTVKYQGEFHQNQYHGEGILYLMHGGSLKGHFENGRASGFCTLTDDKNKMIYQGSFTNDIYNGNGKLFSEDGSYAEGIFINGEPTGIFQEYDKNQNLIYQGEWTDMHRTGKGTAYQNGVKIYEGSFYQNQYHGKGKLYENHELIYSGSFQNGKRSGFGTEFSHDHILYTGLWKNDCYNGCGILYENGQPKFAGTFSDGMKNGRINQIQNKSITQKSIYQNDILIYTCELREDYSVNYYGSIKNNLKNGMGCTFSEYSEKLFEGIFKNNQPEKAMQVFLKELPDLIDCQELADTDYELFRQTPEFVIEKEIHQGIYTGRLKNHLPEGKGTILYFDHRYTGEFLSGQPHGRGTLYLSDGSEVKGIFTSQPTENTKIFQFSEITYYQLQG